MSHIVFIDSSSVGLRAIATSRRLGHRITLVIPAEPTMIEMMGVSEEDLLRFVGSEERILYAKRGALSQDILRVHGEEPVDAVITTSELAVVPTSESAVLIGSRYDSPAALTKAVNKHELRRTLEVAGVPSTDFAEARDLDSAITAARKLGYPLVIKPTRGVSKESSAIVRSVDDLTIFFQELTSRPRRRLDDFISPTFILESYIVGNLYSAEVVASSGRVRLLTTMLRGRARHNDLLEVAVTMPSDLNPAQDQAVVEYLNQVFSCLGLRIGIYHVEFILASDGPRLVEINPRMMGGPAPILFETLTDFDPYELLINLHLGKSDTFQIPRTMGHGAIIAVGATNGGILAGDATRKVEHALLKYSVISNNLKIRDNMSVPIFNGNFSNLGSIVIKANASQSIKDEVHSILSQLEEVLDLPLAKPRW